MKDAVLRGRILRLLHDLYPDSVEEGSLIGIYYQYHPVSSIRRAVQYLCDKGLAKVSALPHPYRERVDVVYYKVSPAGVDLVEGNSPQPYSGIVLPMEAGRGQEV